MDVAFVDDDPMLREANAQALRLAGYEVAAYESAMAALEGLDASFGGVVVTDIRLPQIDGLELFRRLRRLDPELPVILVTGHGDIPMAVDAMRDGAYDFIAKPYPIDRLLASVAHALEKRRLVLENRELRRAAEAANEDVPLLGTTPPMERLRQTLRQVADAGVDVLVTGETGSGKEVVATVLHRWSSRRNRPLVAVNCGALPENMIESELFGYEAGAFTGAQKRRIGRIEHADGGTLFLDEIEAMSPALQVKLLRVLEAREVTPLGTNEVRRVDVRFIAATKVNLLVLAQRGNFREDLFYRLHVVSVRVPPLRERKADIPLLFGHFLGAAAKRFRRDPPIIAEPVRRHLFEHDWPGNVRELAHYAERVALGLADEQPRESTLEATQPAVPIRPAAGSLAQKVEVYEAELIRQALAEHQGDVPTTIEALAIPRKTFYDKLRRHGIDQNQYRPNRR